MFAECGRKLNTGMDGLDTLFFCLKSNLPVLGLIYRQARPTFRPWFQNVLPDFFFSFYADF